MHTIKKLWAFRTKHFSLHVNAVEDPESPDLSWDDDGSVREGLESGKYINFGVVARLYLNGNQIAEDSLWQCIYERPQDFRDHLGIRAKSRSDSKRLNRTVTYGSYFSDMVRTCITEGRKHISDMQSIRLRTLA